MWRGGAVLAPQSDYANVAVGEFQQAAAKLAEFADYLETQRKNS